MTEQEVQEVVEELRNEGNSDEDIVIGMYRLYQHDEITFEQLEALVRAVGWEITDEFKAMSDEDKKTKGLEEVEDIAEEGKDEDKEKDEEEAMSLFGLKGK